MYILNKHVLSILNSRLLCFAVQCVSSLFNKVKQYQIHSFVCYGHLIFKKVLNS